MSLQLKLSKALYKVAQKYIVMMRECMVTAQGMESVIDVSPNDIQIVADRIAIDVIGGAYAIMDNFGTGSLMDKNNPALAQYRNSEYWNELRTGYEIVGRKKGKYKTFLSNEEYESSGKFAGQIIEYPIYPLRDRVAVYPTPPSHAFETAAKWLLQQKEIQETIKNEIETFPFYAFFVST